MAVVLLLIKIKRTSVAEFVFTDIHWNWESNNTFLSKVNRRQNCRESNCPKRSQRISGGVTSDIKTLIDLHFNMHCVCFQCAFTLIFCICIRRCCSVSRFVYNNSFKNKCIHISVSVASLLIHFCCTYDKWTYFDSQKPHYKITSVRYYTAYKRNI